MQEDVEGGMVESKDVEDHSVDSRNVPALHSASQTLEGPGTWPCGDAKDASSPRIRCCKKRAQSLASPRAISARHRERGIGLDDWELLVSDELEEGLVTNDRHHDECSAERQSLPSKIEKAHVSIQHGAFPGPATRSQPRLVRRHAMMLLTLHLYGMGMSSEG